MKVYHWWPGRKWAGPCPIPAELVRQAESQGSVYMTVATQYQRIGIGVAFCRKTDRPSRAIGAQIAVGRLLLNPNYWQIGNCISRSAI